MDNYRLDSRSKIRLIDQAKTLIKNAQNDLGPLSFGQKKDLLLDNMDITSEDAEHILNLLGYKR